MSTTFVSGIEHYEQVIARVATVKKSLWIGTADIKDLHIKVGNSTEPLLAVIAKLLKHGVEVRLIHAKEPGPTFREDFDKYKLHETGLERMLCPRVHFKILVFDCQTAYIGSANLTGAGIGMKSSNRRNFEAGILTDDSNLVDAAMEQFDSVWRGQYCSKCGRKQFCAEPIK
jgi:phosphatidylserine/phosphatidylglycerophosphate/cardiolipin synthase-like enzyme